MDHVFVLEARERSGSWLDGVVTRIAEGRGDLPIIATTYTRALGGQILDAFGELEPGDTMRVLLGIDEDFEAVGLPREDAESGAEAITGRLARGQRRLAGLTFDWVTLERASERGGDDVEELSPVQHDEEDEEGTGFLGHDLDDEEEEDEDDDDDGDDPEDTVVLVIELRRLARRPEQAQDDDEDDLDEEDVDEEDDLDEEDVDEDEDDEEDEDDDEENDLDEGDEDEDEDEEAA